MGEPSVRGPAARRDPEPPVFPHLRQAERGQSLKAASIFEAVGTADTAGKREAVQRRAAAGFQVRFAPHRGAAMVFDG